MNELLRSAESSLSMEDMMAAGLGLTTFGVSMAFIVFMWAFIFVIIVGFYVATTIPIYKMAKRAGLPNAWLAWIPIGEMYIRLKLSRREFNIFNWIVTKDRDKAFIGYLWLAGGFALAIVVLMIMMIIPGLNIIAVFLYYGLMMISPIIFGIFMWRVNYDILMTYGMQEHAMWASVLNYWVPYVMIVMSYIIMNREPDYKA